MRYGSLDDPIAKLQWAIKHYLLIRDALSGRDHQLIRLKMVASGDGLEYKFFAEDVPQLPTDLPLMLGDAYHNARVALDHLVFQLHMRHYRGRIPSNVIKKPAFPVYDQIPNSGGPNHWDAVKRIGKKERVAIERLQPYNQRPGPLYGIRIHLSDLSEINNQDKHRQLYVARTLAQAVPTLESLEEYGLQHHPEFGTPIQTGSLIDTWTFNRKPPGEAMRRQWKFRSAATFEIRNQKIDLIPHLGGSIHVVAHVINRFSQLFPHPTVALDLSQVRPVEPLL